MKELPQRLYGAYAPPLSFLLLCISASWCVSRSRRNVALAVPGDSDYVAVFPRRGRHPACAGEREGIGAPA